MLICLLDIIVLTMFYGYSFNCLSDTFTLNFLHNNTFSLQVSVFPPLASIFVTTIASQFADNLISKGVETTVVLSHFLNPTREIIRSSFDISSSTTSKRECKLSHFFLTLGELRVTSYNLTRLLPQS